MNKEKYDYGIYNGIGMLYNPKDKERTQKQAINYILDRTLMMFKYEGLPETIPGKELERLLQVHGYAIITEVEGKLYAFFGGLGGEPDVYGYPTIATVSNPYLKYSKQLTIGEDCIVIFNDYARMGLIPLVSKYIYLLTQNELTMSVLNTSKRIGNLISVNDDNTAESAREYLKKVEQGELGYIMESKLYDSLKTSSFNAENVSLQELTEYNEYLKASLLTELGINANQNQKRERLITAEIEDNKERTFPLMDNMLSSRQIGLQQIKELFGEDTTVRFNSSWENFNPYNQEVSSDSETDEFLMDRITDYDSDDIDDNEPELEPELEPGIETDEEMDKSEPGESGAVPEEPGEPEEEQEEVEVTETVEEEVEEEVTETVEEEIEEPVEEEVTEPVEEPVEEEIEQLEEEIEQLEEELEELKEEDKEDEVE